MRAKRAVFVYSKGTHTGDFSKQTAELSKQVNKQLTNSKQNAKLLQQKAD